MIRILKALETNGTPDIQEIRDLVGLSISRVRELVKQAIAKGLVEGTPDADDIMGYALTREGLISLRSLTETIVLEDQDDQGVLVVLDDQDDLVILEEPAEEPTAPVKTKRVVLNPQPVIDKKTALLAEVGFTLTYASRMWTIWNIKTGFSFSLDSRTLASVKAAEIVEYANRCLPAETPVAA